ncbi:MAG: nicotinate-nucleotide adenylyltransferase [Pseudomonadota bacterium]
MDPIGMVHGRFQPFHLEHLDYVLSGYKRCKRLIIGITNPEPSEYIFNPASNHRHLEASNLFTYFARMEMIRWSLIDLNLDMDVISFVPFHINDQAKWEDYLPRAKVIVQYVRLFSQWEEEKIAKFRAYGFKVKIIDSGIQKKVTATQVRTALSENGNWQSLVPAATARIIE